MSSMIDYFLSRLSTLAKSAWCSGDESVIIIFESHRTFAARTQSYQKLTLLTR